MRNIWIITRREMRSYFDSPVAYIVISVFLLVAGWSFFKQLFIEDMASMRSFFEPTPIPLSPAMVLAILVPAVTMRLVAEERKSGTIELLTTLPITDTQVVVGKFLGALGLLATALGLTIFYPISVSFLGDLDWGPVLGGYLGMGLFVSALLAIGLATSTVTDNQIVAFIIGVVVCLTLYLINWLQFFIPNVAGVAEYVSLSFHLKNLARGVIDTRDVLYYLTIIGGSLFLAVMSLRRQHA